MRDNSVLSQFTSRVAPVPPKVESEAEQEPAGGEDSLGAFGILRGIRDKSVMLEFRRRDGTAKAFSYSLLEEIEFDSSVGITLKFATRTARIVGRNLNSEQRPNVRLLEALCRHRVPWIQEADAANARRADRGATVIEHIEIE